MSGLCVQESTQELLTAAGRSIFPDCVYVITALTCACRCQAEELGCTSEEQQGRQRDVADRSGAKTVKAIIINSIFSLCIYPEVTLS